MLIREVMTEEAECTGPDTTLQEAARRMKELDVGSLPVCENDRLTGIVTDRDIVLRSVAEGRDPEPARDHLEHTLEGRRRQLAIRIGTAHQVEQIGDADQLFEYKSGLGFLGSQLGSEAPDFIVCLRDTRPIR